ncbi:transcriptional repressor [Streptomyces sp. NPDC005438]|uniref:Fur family transcriptional regulator n=1 Tax=Streptomyces sp. NPDC005438 TaxID=3156880 RepID=UPI0033BAAFE1
MTSRESDWPGALRRRGYRLTPQRQLVLEAVRALGGGTPDELLAQVRRTASGVNISTIYRTLELLEELGLVAHSHLGHGAPSYHLAGEPGRLNLLCRDCARITEVDVQLADDLVERLRDRVGFTADIPHFAIFGRCADCGGEQTAEGPS